MACYCYIAACDGIFHARRGMLFEQTLPELEFIDIYWTHNCICIESRSEHYGESYCQCLPALTFGQDSPCVPHGTHQFLWSYWSSRSASDQWNWPTDVFNLSKECLCNEKDPVCICKPRAFYMYENLSIYHCFQLSTHIPQLVPSGRRL